MAGELADALIARIDTLIQDRLNAAITSRLAASSYVAPDNAGVGGIKSKTDLIPAAGPPSAADYTPARAALLDSLDALISSRATDAGVWAAATRTLTAAPSVIKSVQYGQIFWTQNTAATLTIASVNTAKTLLLSLGGTSADATNDLSMGRLFLESSTTVRAEKWGNGGNGLYANFCVVEFM